VGIGVRDFLTFYGSVLGRAARDTWSAIGEHAGWALAIVVASAAVGILGAGSVSVASELAAILAVGIAFVAFLVVNVALAPVRQARDVAAAVDERVRQLEGRIPSAADGPFVLPDHEERLRDLLQTALGAIENGQPRSLDGQPLLREMFERHFPALEAELGPWDITALRWLSAPVKLRMRFDRELAEGKLDTEPYVVAAIAGGLTQMTKDRSLREELEQPLPPRIGTGDSIWEGYGGTRSDLGIVTFNNRLVGPNVTTCLSLDPEDSQAAYEARIDELLAPLYALLQEAQGWDEAREVFDARQEFRAFSADGLREAIKRAQIKSRFPMVASCPGCE
jgi:hypothetical protein